MHRLGFMQHQIKALINKLKLSPWFEVKTIFSHLAASDSSMNDRFSEQQIQLFDSLSSTIIEATGQPALRHILNSAGIVRFPEARFDMVRLGLGLYGIDTTGKLTNKLRNVTTLKSTIAQIKTIEIGNSVGYNRSWRAEKPTRIGIVNIGYADGLNRKLGNGRGEMVIDDKRVVIIGEICMDLCMVDLTNAPAAKVGDEVIVFGDNPSIMELAKKTETIPYEIMTSVSGRVKRVYFEE